ncbi:hypothetical protein A9Q90_01240 [Gammaproteobacteria bacterium 54_18_T64]|nr:hypothetical protein A9Q90_01240 [Gammaproteobacteria bacterium 54_18_T64]
MNHGLLFRDIKVHTALQKWSINSYGIVFEIGFLVKKLSPLVILPSTAIHDGKKIQAGSLSVEPTTYNDYF